MHLYHRNIISHECCDKNDMSTKYNLGAVLKKTNGYNTTDGSMYGTKPHQAFA